MTYDVAIEGDPRQSEREIAYRGHTIYLVSPGEVEGAIRDSGLKVLAHSLFNTQPTASGWKAGFVVAEKSIDELA